MGSGMTRQTSWGVERTRLRQRPSTPLLRRSLRLVWWTGLLPFLAVAVVLLTDRPEPVRLRAAAATTFAAPLGGAFSAVDRAGAHVALVSGDSDVRILKLVDDRLVAQTIDLPWTYARSGGTLLQWVDADLDELVDLRVMPLLDEELLSQLASNASTSYGSPSREYLQRAGKFVLRSQSSRDPEQLEHLCASEVNVDGHAYQLESEDGWRQLTQLRSQRGGRQSIAGAARQVADPQRRWP